MDIADCSSDFTGLSTRSTAHIRLQRATNRLQPALLSHHTRLATMARDRTPEFRAALSSIRNRTRASIAPVNGSIPIGQRDDSKQNLLINGNGRGTRGAGKEGQKSEFARMAGQISKDLTLTMGKLQKLAQRKPLAQTMTHRTIFDNTLPRIQWLNGKHCSMIGPSRSLN